MAASRAAPRQPSSPQRITVLGSTTCEDTAITRSRLRALDVPFDDVDVDADSAAAERIVRLNGGHRVTPTVVVGDERLVEAEPALERVAELVREAGYERPAPNAVQLHGDVIARSIPLRDVELASDGAPFSLGTLRSRRQVALFLAHGADCLSCFGYARQLARQAPTLDDANAVPVVVVAGSAGAASEWQHGLPEHTRLAADGDGAWRRVVAESLGLRPDLAILVLLDRFLAPRVVSAAAEAGGLIDSSDAVDWLRFLELECPECVGEIGWADQIDWTPELARAD